ncbi:hypothetical protein E2C01_064637 [Portunus trituberculatus]|uniref:Uncharacterized protein n=1 Tax=Portunus trituberculatus TaxID=210409 RepID=A0A5B7HDJ8_PORTR|nr:hypothetical protein [Portunus trituberculatus]
MFLAPRIIGQCDRAFRMNNLHDTGVGEMHSFVQDVIPDVFKCVRHVEKEPYFAERETILISRPERKR